MAEAPAAQLDVKQLMDQHRGLCKTFNVFLKGHLTMLVQEAKRCGKPECKSAKRNVKRQRALLSGWLKVCPDSDEPVVKAWDQLLPHHLCMDGNNSKAFFDATADNASQIYCAVDAKGQEIIWSSTRQMLTLLRQLDEIVPFDKRPVISSPPSPSPSLVISPKATL